MVPSCNFQYFQQILTKQQYSLTHIVLSRILYIAISRNKDKFPPKAHIFVGAQKFIKKLYLGQYGLTHIVLSRILKKFPCKLGYFLVFKCLLKSCIYLINYSLTQIAFLKILQKFPPKAHTFLESKNLFKKFSQEQNGLTHIVLSRILYK